MKLHAPALSCLMVEMSHFAHALDAALAAAGLGSQAELARQSGVPQGQISKHLAGELLPDRSTLEKYCATLHPSTAALARAFALDHLGPRLSRLVEIHEAGDGLRLREEEPLPAVFRRLPPRIARLIETAAHRCQSQPEFLAALKAITALPPGDAG